jgi:glycine cleavage system T protein
MGNQLLRTVFFERHLALGATMTPFGGWEMPVQYKSGIIQEHLATRRQAGVFDVSHMGRFVISGKEAIPFLQQVLSNNAEALEEGEAQYTMIPNEQGGAIDDAYLYRFVKDEYLLVVNASNREKDWAHFEKTKEKFKQVVLEDRTTALSMLSLQGPLAKKILKKSIQSGFLPEPMRNELSIVDIDGTRVMIGRTGYTGEPICFELFLPEKDALKIWDLLLSNGAVPVGLGARDTLRLEAGLPLYGHELGLDMEEREIPVFAMPLARFAVSFSDLKGAFIGKAALARQYEALKRIIDRDYTLIKDLPRLIQPIELLGKGIARAGCEVSDKEKSVGFVTSGTMVPYWKFEGEGLFAELTEESGRRAICLAFLDSDLVVGDTLEVNVRGKKIPAWVVPYHLRSEAPPYARPITCHDVPRLKPLSSSKEEQGAKRAKQLLENALQNTVWRQRECINLIPSEQSPSAMSKMLTIMDPMSRYAEHKSVKAFCDADVFYYQGTGFIAEVEDLLVEEIRSFLGCAEVESRVVSGQMANMAVFSALVDFLNRADRKNEQRRIQKIMNHHIIKGGHLSAQPMGALRDFVARAPQTEKPAVVNFPVLEDNPFQIDVAASRELMVEHKPELIILGKSVILHKEPVKEIRGIIDELALPCVLMYDMAHVLGLVGPYFQEPFKEGAHVVTASTHKTYFGTQRGIVATDYKEDELGWEFWEAIQRRAFPGSTSNHHLGTLVGLLMAAYEMNAFKEEYQKNVIQNAKAFASALNDCDLKVAGDPAVSYTETHQVVVEVGYGKGPDVARALEENNIILNYQAGPDEEGFTASGFLRMGVSEMTRFGMGPEDFKVLAGFIHDVIAGGKKPKKEVTDFRKRFLTMKYCFSGKEFEDVMEKMHKSVIG